MPRRRNASGSAKKVKQQPALMGFPSSSPSPIPGPSKRKCTRRITSSSSSSSDKVQNTDSDVGAIHFVPKAGDASDEDAAPRRPTQRRSLMNAHVIPNSTLSDDSLSDMAAEAPRYRKRRNNVVLDSEEDTRPRSKRKLIKGVRPPTPEEEEDILDGEVLEARLRSRSKTTEFQRNLEKLKSELEQVDADMVLPDAPQIVQGKKRGEIVIESSSSEADQSENSAEIPFKGARPHRSGESDTSHNEADDNQEEDDFIVDDEVLGVPTPQLPLAFSMSAHQDLTHHFKIVCQLFVHIAVRPMAERRPFLERVLKEEEYLSVPLQVTRRKLSAMCDSLVASSTWRTDFKKLIEEYPIFTLTRLEFTEPRCDACQLGGRLSTLSGRLRGRPYDKYDFEDVSDDESDEASEEEDEDEVQVSDTDGKRGVKKKLLLGRFCAARTRVYHQFCHWEYSLYKALQREIMQARNLAHGFVKVAYTGGVKPPRDLYDADKVMEWLDQRRIIEMEWSKVQEMMDNARKLERNGEDDLLGI